MGRRNPIPTNPNYAALSRMTATRCCVCHAQLTDAESVEHGIGPVCSHRYYDAIHQPDAEQVKVALGHVAFSGLPGHIVDGFLALVDNNHHNARKASNLLVYWASCNQHNREEVFKCAGIIRALGYRKLAAKLETDRTDAALIEDGAYITVWVPNRHSISFEMRQIPGTVRLDKKNGHKIGFIVPAARKDWLETVLGVLLGGGLACGPKGVWKIPRKSEHDLRSFKRPASAPPIPAAAPPPAPQAANAVRILKVGGNLEVWTPYRESFKEELKALVPKVFRTWVGHWLIDGAYEETVKRLLAHHFAVQP